MPEIDDAEIIINEISFSEVVSVVCLVFPVMHVVYLPCLQNNKSYDKIKKVLKKILY